MSETVPLRLAQHLAYEAMTTHVGGPDDCELTGFSGEGRCIEPAVAIRWEYGFADQVCEEHANRAKEREAVVVYPKKHNGEES